MWYRYWYGSIDWHGIWFLYGDSVWPWDWDSVRTVYWYRDGHLKYNESLIIYNIIFCKIKKKVLPIHCKAAHNIMSLLFNKTFVHWELLKV